MSLHALVTLVSSNGFWCYNIIVMMLYRIISALMIAGELILCLYISMCAHVSEFVSVTSMGGVMCS